MNFPEISTQDVIEYVQKRLPDFTPNGDQEIRGPCPVHHGDGENFSLNLETGASFCHSQCNKGWPTIFNLEAELSRLEESAAIEKVAHIIGRELPVNGTGTKSKPKGKNRGKIIVALYAYHDEAGRLLYEIVRYDPKEFKVRRPHPNEPGKWLWSLGRGPKKVGLVLYRLPDMIGAERVFVAEGEKDADNLKARGYVATTSPFGADRWKPSYSETLRGKQVIIIPDRDLKGAQHALAIANSSLGIAARIQIVDLPEGSGKDITNFFEAGHTSEEFDTLVAAAPDITDEVISDWASKHDVEKQLVEARTSLGRMTYTLDDKGVWYQPPDLEKERVWLCAPLYILADTRDESGSNWGRQLQWEDPDYKKHTWAMSLGLLAAEPTAVREYLADGGLRLGFSRVAREQLPGYLSTFRVDKKLRCVSRIGLFNNDSFIFPNEVIPADAGEEIVLQTQHDLGRMYECRGNLKQWQTKVAAPCRGNSRLIFSVSVGFAPVFLALLGIESGGFMFIGPSSIGKSTALHVGASVAGHAVRQCRATLNGLEAVCAAHSDSLLCLDELGELNEREVPQFPYLLANGSGKSRMNKLITMRQPLSWRLLYLISGEQSMQDLVRRYGIRLTAGADVRLLLIPGDAGKGKGLFENIHNSSSAQAFSLQLRDAAMQYAGHAYREFIRRLLSERETLVQAVRNCQRTFVTKYAPNASPEVQRAASRYGLVAGAGEAATELGITGWQDEEAEKGVASCFQDYVDLRGGEGAGDVYASVKAAREFLALNGSSRFQPWDDTEARILNRAGFRRIEDGATKFFIFRSVFENEICRGSSPKKVAAELFRKGLLIRDDDEHWTVKRAWPVDVSGNSRLYLLVNREEE